MSQFDEGTNYKMAQRAKGFFYNSKNGKKIWEWERKRGMNLDGKFSKYEE